MNSVRVTCINKHAIPVIVTPGAIYNYFTKLARYMKILFCDETDLGLILTALRNLVTIRLFLLVLSSYFKYQNSMTAFKNQAALVASANNSGAYNTTLYGYEKYLTPVVSNG